MSELSEPRDAAAGPEDGAGVYSVERPRRQTLPAVFASPHSGADYAPAFRAASRLDTSTLRRSEDSFVDEIFAAAPAMGAPLIKALFPRAYVDPNREPFELDPAMFEGPLPPYVNSRSPRIAAGLGTIARVVASGEEIYREKLSFAEAEARIARYYRPYHRALEALIDETRAAFGWCFLIDCHSMPSVGGPMDQDPGMARVDFVLGDAFGASCGRGLVRHVEVALAGAGYAVTRNIPYSGGFTTIHYGRPEGGVHALQIEINRRLYMDERRYARLPGLEALKGVMEGLMGSLAALTEPVKRAG